ncbi:MAG: hypothetical protein A4S09_16590 [Proteobacteria bacterium SG_bin7]|nr:MAG: hypothetical protein A4S09_16590 [Proteobacteria bacterium SG_bin7]
MAFAPNSVLEIGIYLEAVKSPFKVSDELLMRVLIFILFFAKFISAADFKPQITVIFNGKSKVLSIAELKSNFGQFEIEVKRNPAHESVGSQDKKRKYRGAKLAEILERVMPEGAKVSEYTAIFKCFDDNYRSKIDLRELDGNTAVIAYEQDITGIENNQISNDKKWELITMSGKKISPGPFYVVWENARGTYPGGWPFQLVEIEIIKSDQVSKSQDALRKAR